MPQRNRQAKADTAPCHRLPAPNDACVADVYDALTHDRPYKEAWTPAEALAELRACGWGAARTDQGLGLAGEFTLR